LPYISIEECGNFKHAGIDTNQKYPLVFVIIGLDVYATIV